MGRYEIDPAELDPRNGAARVVQNARREEKLLKAVEDATRGSLNDLTRIWLCRLRLRGLTIHDRLMKNADDRAAQKLKNQARYRRRKKV
jgi:hypothetical protein